MRFKSILKEYLGNQVSFWANLNERRQIHSIERNFNELYREVRKNAAPIFVLSTGRCGTALLTEILRKSQKLLPKHEPYPELSYHSALAFKNPRGRADLRLAIDIARYEDIRNAFLLHKRYVETNNRITFFAYYLADLYPNAKFIHLVRNPTDFVKSGLKRDWYSGKAFYDQGRIKDSQLFEKLDQQQKIAWLWAQTNQFAEHFRLAYSNRCFLLRSEDLFGDSDKVLEILYGLGISDISKANIIKETRIKVNRSSTSKKRDPRPNLLGVKYIEELKSYYGYE